MQKTEKKNLFFNISVCRHPYPQFSNLTFTQGVAIGLDLFKPFQGFFRGYQLSILNSQFSILNSLCSGSRETPMRP